MVSRFPREQAALRAGRMSDSYRGSGGGIAKTVKAPDLCPMKSIKWRRASEKKCTCCALTGYEHSGRFVVTMLPTRLQPLRGYAEMRVSLGWLCVVQDTIRIAKEHQTWKLYESFAPSKI